MSAANSEQVWGKKGESITKTKDNIKVGRLDRIKSARKPEIYSVYSRQITVESHHRRQLLVNRKGRKIKSRESSRVIFSLNGIISCFRPCLHLELRYDDSEFMK